MHRMNKVVGHHAVVGHCAIVFNIVVVSHRAVVFLQILETSLCRGGATEISIDTIMFFFCRRVLHCSPPPWLRCTSASQVGAVDVSLGSDGLSSHVDNLRDVSYPFPCSV
jgi:hypothetical protein